MINGNNSIEEEIKERLAAGNRAYFANRALLKNKLLSKRAKLRLYQAVIRPVVTYAAETWTLKVQDKNRLQIFERKVLRTIYRPVKVWRSRTNNEVEKLMQDRTIVRHVKALRLGWFGHVNRMEESRLVKKVYNWAPIGTRIRGRPKSRWKDEVLMDIKNLGVRNWMSKILRRDEWRKVVEQAKTAPKQS